MKALLLKLLIALAGDLITNYILPLFNPRLKSSLETVLPIAERWVAAVETTGMRGQEKHLAATTQILADLKRIGDTGVTRADIDTAIQLAYNKLGLGEKA